MASPSPITFVDPYESIGTVAFGLKSINGDSKFWFYIVSTETNSMSALAMSLMASSDLVS